MVFLPSSPTRIYSIHRGKTTLLPLRASRRNPEQPCEMNNSESSSQQVETNAAVEDLTSTSIQDVTAVQTGEESPHTSSNEEEMLRRTIYCLPSASPDAEFDPEHSPAGDVSPVVGRASSVRVGKAQLIEHWPSLNLSKSKHQSNGHQHSRSSSHSSLQAEQVPESRPYVLPIMPEEDIQEGTETKTAQIIGKQNLSLTLSEVVLDKSRSSERLQSLLDASGNQEAKQHDVIDFALPRLVQNINGTAATAIRGDISQIQTVASETQVQNSSDISTEPSKGLNRALTSPLPVSRGLSRRVTIRPADLVIKHDDRNVSFRETIVTTPYPPRRASDQASMNFESNSQESNSDTRLDIEKKGSKEGNAIMPTGASADESLLSNEAQLTKGEKDRFPSPERPEVLFINLSLLNHPTARTTVEIQISDKGTFDDELLFHQIRTAYSHQLLGFPRLILTLFRKVGYATVTLPASYDAEDFDSISFIRHFHRPCLGRKRKAWVIWLRNHNPRHVEPTLAIPASALLNTAGGAQGTSEHGIQPVRRLSNLKSLSPRTRTSPSSNPASANHSRNSSHNNKSVHTDRDINNADLTKRFSTASQASSYNFVYSPAFPRLPFLSSRHDNQTLLAHPASPIGAGLSSPCRTYFWPSSSSSISRCGQVGSIKDAETTAVKIVTVSFHHQYRVGIIAALTVLNVLLAMLVTALWVIFGVPGTRPEVRGHSVVAVSGQAAGGRGISVAEWELDARKRVLTGVVIGLVSLLVGGVAEGMMIWAAKELL